MIFPNWVDIVMVLFLARQIYKARESNLITEGLRLLGIILATFFALHYYSPIGVFFKKNLIVFDKVFDLVAFSIIAWIIILFFEGICKGWIAILKWNIYPVIDRNVGFFLGVIKSFLLGGIIFYSLCVSGIDSISDGVKNSVTRSLFGNLSVAVYQTVFLDIITPFFPEEKPNTKVFIFSDEDLSLTKTAAP